MKRTPKMTRDPYPYPYAALPERSKPLTRHALGGCLVELEVEGEDVRLVGTVYWLIEDGLSVRQRWVGPVVEAANTIELADCGGEKSET